MAGVGCTAGGCLKGCGCAEPKCTKEMENVCRDVDQGNCDGAQITKCYEVPMEECGPVNSENCWMETKKGCAPKTEPKCRVVQRQDCASREVQQVGWLLSDGCNGLNVVLGIRTWTLLSSQGIKRVLESPEGV